MPHPPSRYARVVVWAVVAIWLETYCWLVANTYWQCHAMPGRRKLESFSNSQFTNVQVILKKYRGVIFVCVYIYIFIYIIIYPI